MKARSVAGSLRTEPAILHQIINDPTGMLERIGDLIVWNVESGTIVLAGLDGLGDQVQRINTVVTGIESTQLIVLGTLGVVQSVALATLGVSSLSAGFTGQLHAFGLESEAMAVGFLNGHSLADLLNTNAVFRQGSESRCVSGY